MGTSRLGADTLDGGADDDILIGSTTDMDSDLNALNAIMAVWSNASIAYQTRISNLAVYLNSSTVHNDASIDSLRGGQGLDWFFTTYLEDIIADLHRGGLETVNYL